MQWWLMPIASFLYLCSGYMFWRVDKHGENPLWSLGVMVLACQAHALALITVIGQGSWINLSVFNVISLFAWSVACLAIVWLWRASMALAGVMIAVVNALIVLLPRVFVSEKAFMSDLDAGMLWHILTGIAAWTVLTVAAVHAVLYGIFFQRLKHKQLKKYNVLSLGGVERVLMSLTLIGFSLLGISLLTGWFYVDDLFAQHLWHKTVLTIVSWLVYLCLLIVYFVRRERGIKIVYLSLLAYVILIVGYVVSNIVIQFIVT